jgi:3-isopropylmalate/(R)-2-methylmalate dehydratase small subunit
VTFETIQSRAVLLLHDDIDTDQIIPARFLKVTSREGLGVHLFQDWRYQADGTPKPDFPLNAPGAAAARVLIAGHNFGCGSSREHAPWALADYGFRAIIAPSFADIFHGNCCQNGLLPVVLEAREVAELCRRARGDEPYLLTVDLVHQRVLDREGFAAGFDIDPYRREMLLRGLDEIGRTLEQEPRIAAFERRRAALDRRAAS